MSNGTWVLKVDSKCRITFPKDLMEHMGWREGDSLLFTEVPGGILVQRVARTRRKVK